MASSGNMHNDCIHRLPAPWIPHSVFHYVKFAWLETARASPVTRCLNCSLLIPQSFRFYH